MHLSPADSEKLLLSVAGMIARDRQSRGVKLNQPEAVALLATWVIERAREGALVEQLMVSGRDVLSADDVMDGVAELVTEVQIEATFPDGRKLVTLHHPIAAASQKHLRVAAGTITLNERPPGERIGLVILNTGDRPVQIGSHLHLPDANAALRFDRSAAAGFRLDIASGTSIRFEPGVSREVSAVTLQGRRVVAGLQLREGEDD